MRVDGLPVGLDALVLRPGWRLRWPSAVRQYDVRADDRDHQQRGYHEQQPLGAVSGSEDPGLADRTEPQVVRPYPSGDRDQDGGGHDDDDRRDDEPRPARHDDLTGAARMLRA